MLKRAWVHEFDGLNTASTRCGHSGNYIVAPIRSTDFKIDSRCQVTNSRLHLYFNMKVDNILFLLFFLFCNDSLSIENV
jgi:hypothetical protein